MVAAFGTGRITPDTPPLVENTPRISARDLPAIGKTIALAWQGIAHAPLTRLSRTADGLVIVADGVDVFVTFRAWPMPLGGERLRFVCPHCGALRDFLHWREQWGCRGCLKLEHACRHHARYCPAIRRRAKLLRKLARVSAGSLRARLLRAEIAREEGAIIAHVRRVNRDLTKRSKSNGRRRHLTAEQ